MSFADRLIDAGCTVEKTTAQGTHSWDYWDTHILDVLAWLPLAGSCVDES
jgi:S-formylglutathione hydrolase FrmB